MPTSAGMNDIQQCPNATGKNRRIFLVLVKPIKRDITFNMLMSLYISAVQVFAAHLLVVLYTMCKA